MAEFNSNTSKGFNSCLTVVATIDRNEYPYFISYIQGGELHSQMCLRGVDDFRNIVAGTVQTYGGYHLSENKDDKETQYMAKRSKQLGFTTAELHLATGMGMVVKECLDNAGSTDFRQALAGIIGSICADTLKEFYAAKDKENKDAHH